MCACTSTVVNVLDPCVLPSGTQATLFYPAPGSTGIPDAIGSVIVTTNPNLPHTWIVVLENLNSGAAVSSSTYAIVDPPFPKPNAPPPFTASYQGFLLPNLAAGTSYRVFLKDKSTSCLASWPSTAPTFTTK
jgi:hypothetical protein